MAIKLLTPQLRQEGLSRAYAHAIAARAGYATSVPYPDKGIDLRIEDDVDADSMRGGLALQLKATTNLRRLANTTLRFDLNITNYDTLRGPSLTPLLLVVLHMPKDESQWVDLSDEELILRHRAYWVNLAGRSAIHNSSTVAIPVPHSNLFTPESLHALMSDSRTHGRIVS